ncbi:hypothetical protein A1O1_05132 [Capronia coronata CBS 617.96]|uniref:Uncharacterized protein n=1 Tax=Capronia coronata CBS 617.96 TaxID=1182541 RepID=W9Y5U4_9EURO|nr:uncharacterized protein A1O1_05132 [Capronia coronata CBS 617.96]EXJ88202.1 hypothetical protein A1O1_05132 [Capronia coronata CBS 617.96]
MDETVPFPTLDWEHNRGALQTSKRRLQKVTRRAEALNRLCDTDRAEPAHAVYFALHHPLSLPLVNSMARVIGAERRSGQANGPEIADLAEVQTIRAVVLASNEVLRHHPKALKSLAKQVNRKVNLLIEHQRTIQDRRLAQETQNQNQMSEMDGDSAEPLPSLGQ